jgi:ribosomal protein L4
MASSGKKKTTFAKLAREQKLRERRRDKQAKKEARKGAGEAEQAQFRDPQATSGGVGSTAE